MATLFALVHPVSRKTGIFSQLGSVVPGRLCIEHCLFEKYGKNNVKTTWLGRHTNTGCLFLQHGATGFFHTKDGIYIVYRVIPGDPLYRKSEIIKQYSSFFGPSVVNDTLCNRMVTDDYLERKNVLVRALGGIKNWLQINRLIK